MMFVCRACTVVLRFDVLVGGAAILSEPLPPPSENPPCDSEGATRCSKANLETVTL